LSAAARHIAARVPDHRQPNNRIQPHNITTTTHHQRSERQPATQR
jgi:hypothetical protein